jgi:TolB-like protein
LLNDIKWGVFLIAGRPGAEALATAEIFLFEGFRLDRRGGGLFRRDEGGNFILVEIGARALDVLGVLAERRGDLISKDEIMAAVWPGTVVEDNNLTVQISALRRILDRGRSEGSCIQTAAGRGYRFVAAVTPHEADALSDHETAAQRAAPAAPRLSIVVLPFANLSDDREQQYFADGITEDLTTDLSRIAGSFVISGNTASTYKGRRVGAKQIGAELGVRYVLEGSLQRSGKQVRVNVQLIDAETDSHLWAERFDHDIHAVLALQNEITSRIAIALNFAMVKAEAARPAANPGALDYIFRARAVLSKPQTRDIVAEAIGLFEHALALDPGSAEAQNRLAHALVGRVLQEMTGTAAADLARADGLLRQLPPSAPFPHWTKGQLLRAQHRYADAIPEYEAAIALDRNAAGAYANLGQSKLLTGSVEAAIPLVQQAIRLSPRDHDLGYWYDLIGLTHLLQSCIDEAIVWLERARSASPARAFIRAHLAAAYGLKGESERGAAQLFEACRLSGDPDRYSSIADIRAAPFRTLMAARVRALYEATYDVGLRRAGMPEE